MNKDIELARYDEISLKYVLKGILIPDHRSATIEENNQIQLIIKEIRIIEETMYERGQRSIQQGFIKLLDLRLLVGGGS